MSIIEKLGITPGPWIMTGSNNHLISTNQEGVDSIIGEFWNKDKKQNNLVCLVAPEMLEALIKNLDFNQRGYFMKQKILKNIIEKACYPKKWEEIKDLS